MLRNSVFSLMSTGIRVLAGSIVFIVMAHAWGPEAFGVFMYPFTIAAVLVKVVDYGFVLQLMRDIGHAPSQARRIMSQALGAKLLLLVPMAVVAVIFSATLPDGRSHRLLFGILMCDALANSFALFFNTPLRALGRFDTEAYIVAGTNVALFSIVVSAVAFGAGPVVAAVGFLAARLGYVVVAWWGCGQVLDAPLRPEWTHGPLRSMLARGFPFAVHAAVGTLGMQVETIMIQHYLGAGAVGLYQAGMRILLGVLLIGDALNSVYLEAMARAGRQGDGVSQLGTRMTRHLLALGVLAFLFTIGGSSWIVRGLYSQRYDALIPLLPFFGLLMLIRYGGISYGTLLTLSAKQLVRALAVIGMVILGVALNALLIPRFGLLGAIGAACMSNIALYSVYIAATWRDHRTLLIDWRSTALLLVAGTALVLLLLPANNDGPIRVQIGLVLCLITGLVAVTRTEWITLSRTMVRLGNR